MSNLKLEKGERTNVFIEKLKTRNKTKQTTFIEKILRKLVSSTELTVHTTKKASNGLKISVHASLNIFALHLQQLLNVRTKNI